MSHPQPVTSVWDVLEDTPRRAAKMRICSELMMTLSDIVHSNNLTPGEAAELFGVTTAVINDLSRGRMKHFSLDDLVGMAATAGMTPSIQVALPRLLPRKKPCPENCQSPVPALATAALPAEPQSQPTTKFPPLSQETRTHVSTEHAAWLLGRACQTLRVWACYETKGPLRPIRVAGRLAWPVTEIKRTLGVK